MLLNILAAIFLLTCLPSALIDFALPKWRADKNIQIEDAYKWTYQATRGGEHAIPDTESARKWLENEWRTLGDSKPSESLWEPLCPGGEIGRLNLRAFRARGGMVDDLLEAFLASSRDYRSDGTNFLTAWAELGKRLRSSKAGNLNHRAWKKLDDTMKSRNYPAIHHSETYGKTAHPAYRILTSTEMKKLLAK